MTESVENQSVSLWKNPVFQRIGAIVLLVGLSLVCFLEWTVLGQG